MNSLFCCYCFSFWPLIFRRTLPLQWRCKYFHHSKSSVSHIFCQKQPQICSPSLQDNEIILKCHIVTRKGPCWGGSASGRPGVCEFLTSCRKAFITQVQVILRAHLSKLGTVTQEGVRVEEETEVWQGGAAVSSLESQRQGREISGHWPLFPDCKSCGWISLWICFKGRKGCGTLTGIRIIRKLLGI